MFDIINNNIEQNMSDLNERDKNARDAEASGLRKGLTSYGDSGFSLFLRKAFITRATAT
jgi:dihydroxy-acid dehydratase